MIVAAWSLGRRGKQQLINLHELIESFGVLEWMAAWQTDLIFCAFKAWFPACYHITPLFSFRRLLQSCRPLMRRKHGGTVDRDWFSCLQLMRYV